MALSKIIENSLADEAVSSAKLKDFAAAVDLNGVELVLDADADTSITADTDDRIDFKIANTDHISFGTSSGDTVIKAMVDAKDILFQQFDGRTLLDINDGGFVGIANGATSSGEIRFFEDTDNGSNYVGLNAGSISSSFTLTLPTADGSSGQFLKTDGSGALSFDTVSSAADDLTTGDAAVTLATSSGNITIDAQGGDTDIIFKGTDGSSDITPMTLDMSDAGALLLTGGKIDLKNSGTRSKILFYCESGNAHAQTLQAAPHSESASNTLTLPSTGGDVDLVSTASTATLTNKTLTTPVIAEIDNSSDITLDAGGDIILDADGGDFNFKDGGTEILRITNSSSDVIIRPVVDAKDLIFQQRDGTEVARVEDNGTFNIVTDKLAINGTAVTSTAAELNILDGVTATASELNLLDGDTSVGSSITLADADGFVVNDGGTMKTIPASDIKTYNPGGTAWQSVVTGNTTMVAGRGYFVNTTSAAITMTLPSSASIGDTIQVIDYAGTADTNNITIGRNSHKIQGDAADLTVSTERAAFTLVYVDATQGWLLDSK